MSLEYWILSTMAFGMFLLAKDVFYLHRAILLQNKLNKAQNEINKVFEKYIK